MLSASGSIQENMGEGGGGLLLSASIRKGGGGGGGGAVRFRPNTKSGGEGLLREVPCMKGGVATPNLPVSTSVQGIHEDDLEWYVTLVVYTHASLKSGIMETVACEQQSGDQSVYTTEGITYTMPVLYGHNGAVDNTQTPKFMPSTHWKSCTHNCLYDVYIDCVVPHYKSHTK